MQLILKKVQTPSAVFLTFYVSFSEVLPVHLERGLDVVLRGQLHVGLSGRPALPGHGQVDRVVGILVLELDAGEERLDLIDGGRPGQPAAPDHEVVVVLGHIEDLGVEVLDVALLVFLTNFLFCFFFGKR